MKHMITIILTIIFLGLAAYSIYAVFQFNANSTSQSTGYVTTHHHPINNKNISSLTVTDLSNNTFPLKKVLKHDINVINIWASWCGPCNAEMPELVAFDHEKPNHIGLIGMNVSDKKNKREAFIKKYNAKYPIIILDQQQMKKNKIINIPTTLFVDKRGKVMKTYVGELNREKLTAILSDFK